jgi:hypothetical protein
MNLDDARTEICGAFRRMDALYGQAVFDEWVIVALKPDRGLILSYSGPRDENYKRRLLDDLQPLRTDIADRTHAVGDFDFAANATGTGFDAYMRVGETTFLFCNNVAKTMDDIRRAPRWLEAQKVFVALSEKFHADPVE